MQNNTLEVVDLYDSDGTWIVIRLNGKNIKFFLYKTESKILTRDVAIEKAMLYCKWLKDSTQKIETTIHTENY